MFDRILNVTLREEKVSTSEVTQRKIEILLRPNSPNSQIQKVEILDWPQVLISLKENSSTW